MASFPTLSSGKTVMYPLEETVSCKTKVVEFQDGTCQRWRQVPALRRFTIQLLGISAANLATVRTFFESSKGKSDTTWDLTIGGTTYSKLGFDTDDFRATEKLPKVYDVVLPVKQFQ